MADEHTAETTADGAATAESPPAAPAVGSPASTESPAAPGSTTPDGERGEDIYDTAFMETLGRDLSSNGTAPAQTETPSTPAPPDVVELTDEEATTLSRMHMKPEMVKSWGEDDRANFFKNAQKRESDQQASFNKVRQDLAQLQEAASSYLQEGAVAGDHTGGAPPSQQNGQAAETTGQPPNISRARQVVDELADIYGDDIKPLGDVLDAVGQQVTALKSEAATVPVMNQMLAQLSLDSALDRLVRDYPTLSEPKARSQVVEQFEKSWANSAHRTDTDMRYLDRVRAGVRDAAKELFGNVTEATAQANLVNTSKQRLLAQPPSGNARGNAAPMSQDQVYEQAFEKHLAPSIRR